MDEIEKKAEEIRAEIEGAKAGATEAKAKAESVEVKDADRIQKKICCDR